MAPMSRGGDAVRSVDDTSFEESLRPGSFGDFVGQRKTVTNLQVAIKAARKRKEALDHVLFSGLPGLGKTTLARIVALEMKSNFHVTSGPILKRPGDLAGMLTKLEEGDVLFIDEIHRILPDVEEYLYTAMEDYFISINVDTGPAGRTINLPLKKFTLIGATTREGLLSDPFRARFGILEKLEWYPVEDLIQVLTRSARILGMEIAADAAKTLGARARGTPRIANRFLRRVRDLAQVRGHAKIETAIAAEALKMLGVDDAGLDELDRRILQTLINHAGGPLGLKTISVSVGEQEDTIEEVYEPYLIQQNFLLRTSRGRKATEKAYKHLGIAADGPSAPQRQLF